MNDETGFESFLRRRLEDGLDGGAARLPEIVRFAARERSVRPALRRARAWGGGLLAAASLAVACSFAVLHGRDAAEPDTVACVIDLLRASDGDAPEEDGESVVEMLLAWQDAPYESAVEGLLAEN